MQKKSKGCPTWRENFKQYERVYSETSLRPYLILMYNSLFERRLEVKLPEPDPLKGKKPRPRKIENTNPLWYQNHCSDYWTDRKGIRGKRKKNRKDKFVDTRIRRSNVLRNLENLIKNGYSHSLYARDYIKTAKKIKYQEELIDQLDKRKIKRKCPELLDLNGISSELRKNFHLKSP